MPGQWIGFSRLRSSCAPLILIGGLAVSAAQADPLYLPTPMGTERFARSAVNSSVLKVFGYAETESRQTFCGPTSLAIVMNSLGLNDPTPPSLFPYHLVTQDTVFTPANLLVKSYDEVDRGGLVLDQLARFAANLKLSTSVFHAADLSASDMRARLIAALGQPDSRVIVNFNRASLGQQGEGHFSPLVAYDAASELVPHPRRCPLQIPAGLGELHGSRYQHEGGRSGLRPVARRLIVTRPVAAN